MKEQDIMSRILSMTFSKAKHGNKKIYPYVVPLDYLNAKVHDDFSGLLEHEIEEIRNFENNLIARHGNADIILGDITGLDDGGDAYFSTTNSINNVEGIVCKIHVVDSN